MLGEAKKLLKGRELKLEQHGVNIHILDRRSHAANHQLRLRPHKTILQRECVDWHRYVESLPPDPQRGSLLSIFRATIFRNRRSKAHERPECHQR